MSLPPVPGRLSRPCTGGRRPAPASRGWGPRHLVAEMRLELVRHLLRQRAAGIEHHPQQALDLDAGIEPLLDLLDGGDQIGQPLQRVIFALHRDQHRLRRRKGVDGQQIQGRRTIQQHEIVVVGHLRQRDFQPQVALLQIHQVDFRASEFAIGRNEVEMAGFRTHPCVAHADLVEQDLVNRRQRGALLDACAHGRVALRVEVGEQHALAEFGECRGKVDCRRGFSYPALLVGYRQDSAHSTDSRTIKWRVASSPGTARA